jgi:hypothetical protein
MQQLGAAAAESVSLMQQVRMPIFTHTCVLQVVEQ